MVFSEAQSGLLDKISLMSSALRVAVLFPNLQGIVFIPLVTPLCSTNFF